MMKRGPVIAARRENQQEGIEHKNRGFLMRRDGEQKTDARAQKGDQDMPGA